MPLAAAVAVAGIGGSLMASGAAKSAANTAAAAQTAASQAAIAQQDKQFTQTRADLQPWTNAGSSALSSQMDLLGLGGRAAVQGSSDWGSYMARNPDLVLGYTTGKDINGNVVDHGQFATPEQYAQWHYENYGKNEGRALPTIGGNPAMNAAEAQQASIDSLKGSPLYQSLFNNGRDTILANASATGGLRGGNTQGALANFGRDTLAGVIQNQLANLGGLSSAGQNSAAQTGQIGAQNSAGISQLLTQQGQAQGGAALAGGAANAAMINGIAGQIPGLANSLFGGGGGLSADVGRTIAANPSIF